MCIQSSHLYYQAAKMLHYGASRHPLQAYVTCNLEVSAEIKIASAFFIYVCHVNSDTIERHGSVQTKVRLGEIFEEQTSR